MKGSRSRCFANTPLAELDPIRGQVLEFAKLDFRFTRQPLFLSYLVELTPNMVQVNFRSNDKINDQAYQETVQEN
jgi:hypothetical protein